MFFKKKNKQDEIPEYNKDIPMRDFSYVSTKERFLVDGETFFSCWWSAFKFVTDCTIYMALSNYTVAQMFVEPSLRELKKYPPEKLEDYLTEQQRVIQFLGDPAVARYLAEFAKTDEIYSQYIFLSTSNNIRIRFFKGIEFNNGHKLMGVDPAIIDTIAFCQWRLEKGEPIMLLTESQPILELLEETQAPIPYRNITTA